MFCLVYVCTQRVCIQRSDAKETRIRTSDSAFQPANKTTSVAADSPQNQWGERKKKGFVTIATIGPRPLTVGAHAEPQQVVRQVIAHWRGQFARVLPDQPDLIVFSSMYHGGLMQAYWAYSCRSHFVGAIAGRATPSRILNPLGQVVASNTDYFDSAVARINLDCALVHLDFNWSRLRALKEKYGPAVTITDPGLLGSVLIASEHEVISIDQMIEEFELERLDDYMARSLAHRLKPGNME